VAVIFPVIWYGCVNWSLILTEKLRLRVFEKTTERGTILSVLLTGYYSDDQPKKEMVGSCRKCGGKEEVRTEFCWGNLREKGHLEGPGVDRRLRLKWIFRK
jgi:hypothetical protein